MNGIYFNPWNQLYKQPFGATAVNQVIHFQIQVTITQVSQVYLVIHKDFGETQRVLLQKKDADFYAEFYKLDKGKGLYFYHFEIQMNDSSESVYYGSHQGGEGRIEKHREKLWEFQLTCYETEDPIVPWYRQAVFYQIFPDRFFNGNENDKVNQPKKNSFLYATKADEPMYIKDAAGEILRWDFYGGNLKGIEDKIPYLKKLGVNALYLNPIFEAASNHRYDTADYLVIDPVLGTLADFEKLVATLKAQGMYLMLDGVFSHVGQNSRYFNRDGSYGKNRGAYQNPQSPYFSWFQFFEYPQRYQSWWGIADLPTIDKLNPTFQQFIYGGQQSVIDQWTSRGVDAWRLDVADELPEIFIEGIRQKLDQYTDKVLIGEVWEDASNKISYQQRRQYILGGRLQGVMNYPLRDGILSLLNHVNSPEEVARMLTTLIENYPRFILYSNLNNLGTHDTERIFSMLNQDVRKFDLAFGLLFFFIGVPCIYYGDEAGLTGGKDPENRKFFPWDEQNIRLFTICQNWIMLRKTSEVLIEGEIHLFYNSGLFGIVRTLGSVYQALVVNPTESSYQITEPLSFTTSPVSVAGAINRQLENVKLEGMSYHILEGQV